MNKLLTLVKEKLKNGFAQIKIPEDCKTQVVTSNLKGVKYFSLVLFVPSIIMFGYYVITDGFAGKTYLLTYYLFLLASTLSLHFFSRSLLRSNKEKYGKLKHTVTYLFLCTMFLLCLYNVLYSEESLIIGILFFSVFSLISIMVFNFNPLFFLVMVIVFTIPLYYKIKMNGMNIPPLNLVVFDISIWYVDLYKRRAFVRELKQKKDLANKNLLLKSYSEELEQQREKLLDHKEVLEAEVCAQTKDIREKSKKIENIQINTIMGLSNLVENRDEDTGNHTLRTSYYVNILAKNALSKGLFSNTLTEDYVTLVTKAAPMHDIGKIIVPDSILKKPDRLTPEEFEQMKRHALEGGRIVREVLGNTEEPEYVKIAQDIATYHHEKYDGSGYPYGKAGNEIPLSARIMAVADVFDALVSPRCYKKPKSIDEAFGIIQEDSGKHFDPVLASIFINLRPQIEVYLEDALKDFNEAYSN